MGQVDAVITELHDRLLQQRPRIETLPASSRRDVRIPVPRVFGKEMTGEVAVLLDAIGHGVPERAEGLFDALGLYPTPFSVAGEPTATDVVQIAILDPLDFREHTALALPSGGINVRNRWEWGAGK